MEENQQDFQPIIIGEGKDSIVRRSMLTDNGPCAQQTIYHEDMVANVAELPR